MSYQAITGPLMANSHPGSYCGQDAYSDMLITETSDGIRISGIRSLQGNGCGFGTENEGLQGCNRPYCTRGQMNCDKNNCTEGGDRMSEVSSKTVVRRLTPL